MIGNPKLEEKSSSGYGSPLCPKLVALQRLESRNHGRLSFLLVPFVKILSKSRPFVN